MNLVFGDLGLEDFFLKMLFLLEWLLYDDVGDSDWLMLKNWL